MVLVQRRDSSGTRNVILTPNNRLASRFALFVTSKRLWI